MFWRKTPEEKLRDKIVSDAARVLHMHDIPRAEEWDVVHVDSTMGLSYPASQTVQVTLRRRLR